MLFNRLIASDKIQKIFLTFTLLIIVTTFIQMFGKAYRPEGYDFTSYLLAAQSFFQGNSPYLTSIKFPYLYPLFPCIYLLPFTLLPYAIANALWFTANLFGLVYSLFVTQSYINPKKNTWNKILLCAVIFVLLLNIARNNFLNGQINFLVIALCVLFFQALQKGSTIKSSLYLAAAIATKLTPVIFVFYLLFSKQYKTCLWTILFALIFSFVLPAFIVGPEKTLIFYQEYLNSLKSNTLLPQQHYILLSLPSIFKAVFHKQASVFFMLMSTAVCVIALFLLQKRGALSIILFSLYMITPLLISPISETHHLANLFIPVLVAAQYKLNHYMLIIAIILLWLGNIFAYVFFLATMLLIILLSFSFQKLNLAQYDPNARRDFHIL